jgi:UDP-N-acetylglucosamine/UDP-N-acetylgalactosamine diphosphorylase
MDNRLEHLKSLLAPVDQLHVLQYWDELDEAGKTKLYHQCQTHLRSAEYLRFLDGVLKTSIDLTTGAGVPATISPPQRSSVCQLAKVGADVRHNLRSAGLELVRQGKAAVIILAGGSGTRLGTTFPKGILVCPQLHLGASLFEMHCSRIRKVEQLANASAGSIFVAIMTSEQTDTATKEYLTEHKFFGLLPSQVAFFQQSSLPCYTEDLKILMETKGSIATAPGGNGGVWNSIAEQGVLAQLTKVGVEYAQIITVDNILAKAADPVFFGYAVEEKADVVAKVTPKAYDQEKVGVFAVRGPADSTAEFGEGSIGVIEYTEIGAERSSRKDERGERVFDAANIAIHLVSLTFLHQAAEKMKSFQQYHAAKKAIPTTVMADPVKNDGKRNGWKIEAFIFDLFQFVPLSKVRLMEVERAEEFAPIKNSDSEEPGKVNPDSPASAVALLQSLHASWLTSAAKRHKDFASHPKLLQQQVKVEIHPLASYEGEGIADEVVQAFIQWLENPQTTGGQDVFVVRAIGGPEASSSL